MCGLQAMQELGLWPLLGAVEYMGDESQLLEPASPLRPLTPQHSEQMWEVFNSGLLYWVLQEAVGLPSLSVYGVDGVIFSPLVTWTHSRCAQAGARCVWSCGGTGM